LSRPQHQCISIELAGWRRNGNQYIAIRTRVDVGETCNVPVYGIIAIHYRYHGISFSWKNCPCCACVCKGLNLRYGGCRHPVGIGGVIAVPEEDKFIVQARIKTAKSEGKIWAAITDKPLTVHNAIEDSISIGAAVCVTALNRMVAVTYID